MNSPPKCPNCGIALAYKAKGEDQLAAIASHIAAQNRGEMPQGTLGAVVAGKGGT